VASSDPTTVTVSPTSLLIAAGEVRGTITLTTLIAGGADVTASGVSGTVGSQTLHITVAPAAADNTKTSEALIETARLAGQLTDEQALVYRVYAAYGSTQLPAQYSGRIDVLLDSSIRTDVNQQWPTLSAAAQTALTPYLMPPIYAGSWGDPAVRATIGTSAQTQKASVRASLVRAAAAPATAAPAAATPTNPNPCSSTSAPVPGVLPGWAHIDTKNFRIWYRTVTVSDRTPYTLAEGAASAGNIAAIAEEVYASEVSVMGRAPLPDTNVACNGGDSRIDVYMDRVSFAMAAQVVAYPGGCNQAPAYMWMSPDRTQDLKIARDLFAHEFLHLIQFSYAKAVDCNQYGWIDEGTAMWAIEHVYHGDNYEHSSSDGYFSQVEQGMLGVSAPLDTQEPIATNYAGCAGGYCTYPFFQYGTRKFGDSLISQIYAASESDDPIASINTALGSGTALRDAWQNFALDGYNDWKNGVANDFYQWDSDPAGYRSSLFDPKVAYSVIDAKIGADLNFALAVAFTPSSYPGRSPIYRLSNRVIDIRFSDPTVSFIQYVNQPGGIAGAAPGVGGIQDPNLKIWAIKHINGAWQTPEDWTQKSVATFCRDKTDEQIDELVLIYSNGNSTSRGTDASTTDWYIELDPNNDEANSFLPQMFVSNVGCFQWQGTSKVTLTDTKGGVKTASATVTFEADPNFLGGATPWWNIYYQPTMGTLTLQGTGIDEGAGCTEDIPAVSMPLSAGADDPNGYMYVNYGPPVAPASQRTADGGGQSTIPNVTFILSCPDNTHPIVVDALVNWLIFDASLPPTGAKISDDGRTLSGSVTFTDPSTGVQTVSEWNLQAQKQN
jgi:hypothetical protein